MTMPASNLSSKKIDISIIIINYNLADEIENCLNSLLDVLGSTKAINYEIIIVDNNSPNKKIIRCRKKI